jgi:hypothetical protein
VIRAAAERDADRGGGIMGAWAARLRQPVIAAILVAASLSPLPAMSAAAVQPSADPIDLALVLAVDISYSMDAEEQQLQRAGYATAMTSKPVLDAIRHGMLGKIAVAYVEWAGSDEQRTLVPWTLIDGPDSAAVFASRLEAAPLRRAYRTSISGGLIHSARLFDAIGFDPARKVIDISGDGPNNQGLTVETVRDEVVERGIVINGLPLMLKRPSYAMMDLGDLDVYYRDCVIGGAGAFVLPVRSIEQFPEAVRTKLVMEIAGLAPDRPALSASGRAARVVVQADAPEPEGSACTVGEQLWRDRFGN